MALNLLILTIASTTTTTPATRKCHFIRKLSSIEIEKTADFKSYCSIYNNKILFL